MRKILALLVLMVVGFGSVFAYGSGSYSSQKGRYYTSDVEIITNNIPQLVSDWKENGWDIDSVEITYTSNAQIYEDKEIPESIKIALKDGYAYSHDHSEEILLDNVKFDDGVYNNIFVKRVMTYDLGEISDLAGVDNVMLVKVYADYWEKIE